MRGGGTSKHFTAGGLIEARSESCFADGIQDSETTQSPHVRGPLWDIEAHTDVALSREIVNFIRLYFSQNPGDAAAIREISIDQFQLGIGT